MNILAADCAVSRLCIAVKYDGKLISQAFDVGMRQSELLVPALDELLRKAGITAGQLDATALTIGPGSFTGLRLGISALKAIELAYGVPVYGISSLENYAYPFSRSGLPVLACIDANKDKFYASIVKGSDVILKEDDWECGNILSAVQELPEVIVAGQGAEKLTEILRQNSPQTKIRCFSAHFDTAESLIAIAEEMIAQKKEPLKDYDGPVYLRASEAELKLNGQI